MLVDGEIDGEALGLLDGETEALIEADGEIDGLMLGDCDGETLGLTLGETEAEVLPALPLSLKLAII